MTEVAFQMRTFLSPDTDVIDDLVVRPAIKKEELSSIIDEIFEAVRSQGDQAILELTKRFDKVKLKSLIVNQAEIEEGLKEVDKTLKEAIDVAFNNILTFHKSQQLKISKIETTSGVTCWQEARPIGKIGLYIPGGTAPLFSSVLMLGVPALVAGCDEIVLCSPPQKDGKIHPAILYAAAKCGITQIIKAGGAQAIAGMVLGTGSIPPVYKIFGPGNQFVMAAKMKGLNYGVAIDLPAGPSEVLIFADETANPAFVAADLLSQAEHGIDSQVVLVTTSKEIISAVNGAINRQLPQLERADTARLSLSHAFACVFADIDSSYNFINRYAPEHLILASDEANEHIGRIQNAGSVFIGHYTPESAGDYASGTNHTLPTAAFSRAYSGVSLDSFVKKITFQEITQEGIRNLGPTIITMAQHEALTAHAGAVSIRLKNI